MKRPRSKPPAQGASAAARLRPTAPPHWLREEGAEVVLDVMISPSAAHTRVMGTAERRLIIQLAAAPTAGQSHRALVQFLAASLQIESAQITLMGSPRGRLKTIHLAQVPIQRVLLALTPRDRD